MSLVFEALQKAEREKQNQAGAAPSPAPPTVPPPTPPQPPTTVVLPKPVRPTPSTTPPMPATPKSQQTVLVVLAACVAVVAIVAIVFIVSRTLTPAHKTETVASPSATASNVTPVAPNSTMEPPAVLTALPPVTLEERYKITGIMPDADGSLLATINGRVVAISNYVDGAIIKKIERDRVTLDINGKEAVVRLF